MKIKRALLASLVLLALVFCAVLFARHQYGEKVAARVWPLQGFAPPIADTAEPWTNTVLLLGDSRIAQWGRPEIPGWRVLNAGVSGMTSGELALSCGAILEQTRPQVVVIEVGINDLKLLGVRPGLREAVVGGCLSNILSTVEQCRRCGARVIVSPVWPAGPLTPARWLVWSGAVDPALGETNLRLARELAPREGVSVVDLFAVISNQNSSLSVYRDTFHITAEKYEELTKWLAGAVGVR